MDNKILIHFMLIFLIISPIPALSIEVGGHITEDTTWTPDNNPYHVTANIFIDTGVTLTIEPGTIIEIGSAMHSNGSDPDNFKLYNEESEAKMFLVNGRIIAHGTEEDSIIFTRDQNLDYYRWGVIVFPEGNESVSSFKHCIIEFTHEIFNANNGENYRGAICPDNGKLILENSLIQNVEWDGVAFEKSIQSVLIRDNIFKTNVTPLYGLANTYIYFNPSYGADYCSTPLIAGNMFYDEVPICILNSPVNIVNNKFYNGSTSLYIDTDFMDHNVPSYIYGNIIKVNSIKGIEIHYYESDTVYVKKNDITTHGSGIHSHHWSNVEISHNFLDSCRLQVELNCLGKVYNNIVQNCTYGGAAFRVYGNNEVYNNIVQNCRRGWGCYANMNFKYGNNLIINNEYAFSSLYSLSLFENSIIVGNDNVTRYPTDEDSVEFRNCVFDFELPEGCIDGGGNLWQDPMFVDVENGDYHLLPGSPCIDGGFDTLSTYYPLFDLDNNYRIWDGDGNGSGIIDIGVYEYGSQYIGGIDGTVYIYDTEEEPLDYVLLKINNQNSQFEFADSLGFFHFDLPPGIYDIYASRVFCEDVVIEDIEVVEGQVTQVDFEMINITDITDNPISLSPPKHIFMYNYPNPFNPSTTIVYQLQQAENISLKIYDVTGRLIKTIVDENKEAGYYNVVWDGTDQSGKAVSSGVYMYALHAGDYTETRKCLLLK